MINFAITFAVAFGLSYVATPIVGRLASRWGIVAVPGGRRKHAKPVPKMGSAAMYIAFVVAVLLAQLLPVERGDPKETIRLIGLLVGGTVLILVGLVDDRRELDPLPQFMAQLLAAAIAISCLVFIEYFNNPLTGEWTPQFPFWLTIVITVVWLVGMVNTVNWLDGVDGLAAGVTAISSAVLFINAAYRLEPQQQSVALLPVALLGATLGFLPHNFFPARVFIGGGALWLGYTLGALSIIGGAKMAAVLLVMGGPILDVAWQIISRIWRGQNPTVGDRGHLHFRLLDQGISQRRIVILYYLFCAVFGTLTLVVSSQLFKLVALGVMALIVLGGLIWLTRQESRRKS